MTQLQAPFDLDAGSERARPAASNRVPAPRPPHAVAVTTKLAKTLPSFIGCIVPSLLLLAWAIASTRQWVPPQILPPPAAVGQTLLEQVESGELFTHFGISLGRVLDR